MKKNILAFFLFSFVCVLPYSGYTQNDTLTKKTKKVFRKRPKLINPFITEGTIDSRFTYIYKTSSTYQEYKVIKMERYKTLQQNVKDSLTFLKSEIAAKNNLNTQQESEISTLNSKVENLNQELNLSNKNKDSISIFGIQLYKENYNLIVLVLIFLLLSIAAYFIYRFKSSHAITSEAQNLLTETQEEFETFQKKSLQRQQQLNRKLQDEIIKNRKEE